MQRFRIKTRDAHTKARTGTLMTDRGPIQTPIFMPVGTLGTVKAVSQRDLEDEVRAEIILGNTYHLFLRPGLRILESVGGLHKFMNWEKPILTDSGGFQVYSLSGIRKISEEGVAFRSHIDGSKLFFSPEIAIDIQRSIGADIIMAFDECTPYPCEYDYAKKSMEMTHRWLKRCVTRAAQTKPHYGHEQLLFPIVQGSVYKDLRKISAQAIAEADCPGNAIGGLSVGEPHEEMYEMTDIVTDILPVEKPRYLMGVGTPANLLECIALGIDMFDCVMPTRNARNATIFTSEGYMNMRNAQWKNDFSPIDEAIDSPVSNRYSKAYLRHLITNREMLGAQIASVHNLSFYLWLMREARKHIEEGDFEPWKKSMVEKVSRKL